MVRKFFSAVLLMSLAVAAPAYASTGIVRVQNGTTEPNKYSSIEVNHALSSDGRYVVITSGASNLVPGDTNTTGNIYRFDTQAGTLVRASLSDHGAMLSTEYPSVANISPDGRYVTFNAFVTTTPFVTGLTNTSGDVFVRDIVGSTTALVSKSTSGTPSNSQSDNGRFSGNGQFIVYASDASNLVPNDTNAWDVFIRDVLGNITERVSLSAQGAEIPSGAGGVLADDGPTPGINFIPPEISNDGRYIVFSSVGSSVVADTPAGGKNHLYLRDRTASTTVLVDRSYLGVPGNNASQFFSLSGSGQYIAFDSLATNLISGDGNNMEDVFLRDTTGSTTQRISVATDGTEANGNSYSPSISSDGRYIAFSSSASNLVAGDTNGTEDIFVRDTQTNTTARVSVSGGGTEANAYSYGPVISADGKKIAFTSAATNLTADTYSNNGTEYVFIADNPLAVSAGGGGNAKSSGGGPIQVISWSSVASSPQATATDTTATSTQPVTTATTTEATSTTSLDAVSHTQLLSVVAPYKALLESLIARGVTLPPLIAQMLQELQATTVFPRDLGMGMTGDDVYALQQYLAAHTSGPAVSALSKHGLTHFFGTLTHDALQEFQKTVGIVPATGFFGPFTRTYVTTH